MIYFVATEVIGAEGIIPIMVGAVLTLWFLFSYLLNLVGVGLGIAGVVQKHRVKGFAIAGIIVHLFSAALRTALMIPLWCLAWEYPWDATP